MGSIAVTERNKMLDAWAGRTTYTHVGNVWVKLHLGSPGLAGTANPAAHTTRGSVTFGSAASAGLISNTATITFGTASATETYTHVSCWNSSTAGTFLGSDDLASAASVVSGDVFTMSTGDLDIAVM